MENLSEKQIKDLKAKHGEIFLVQVEDKQCILRKPLRKDLSIATRLSAQDPMKFNEVILEQCWIEGDEEIKKEDSYYLAVSGQIAEIIEVKQASIKKL